MDSLQLIVPVITAIGGGFIGAYFQAIYQHKKTLLDDIHNHKKKRYDAIMIMLISLIDPDPSKSLEKIKLHRSDIHTIQELKEELKVEMMNCMLFSDDKVVKGLVNFLQKPCYENYIKAVAAMRNDIWKNKTKLKEEDIKLVSL